MRFQIISVIWLINSVPAVALNNFKILYIANEICTNVNVYVHENRPIQANQNAARINEMTEIVHVQPVKTE